MSSLYFSEEQRHSPQPFWNFLVVDLPSQNLTQNQQYRDTVTCLQAHTEQRFAKVAKVRIFCARSGSIVILLPPTHQQGSRNKQGRQMNLRCTIMTKTACLCPNSCATNDGRQMRMTDKDTPHLFFFCCIHLRLRFTFLFLEPIDFLKHPVVVYFLGFVVFLFPSDF